MKLLFGTLLAVLAVTLPSATNAWSWWPWSSPEPYWDNLRTTFVASKKAFNEVPRNLSDSKKAANWVPLSSSCTNNGLFNGLQYAYSDNGSVDTSVTALFDKNGLIVGIQMNIAVSEAKANPNNTYKFDEIDMFLRNTVAGVDSYTLTAYFTDPSTICSTGRNAAALTTNGTADQVFFQNGRNPTQLVEAPVNRTVALAQGWSDNNCFVGMGVHNWYEQEKFQETNCDYVRPYFLLYNKSNVLIGFGFQHVGKSTSPSGRYEYPPAAAVKIIVGGDTTQYQCLLDAAGDGGVGVTTLHVYLINSPLTQALCII